MGISPFALQVLVKHLEDGHFSGLSDVLQLGRQHVHNEGLCRQVLDKASISTSQFSTFDDIALFKSLGFTRVESADYSEFENATHVFDLNFPIPENLRGNFDLVFDGGTIEHIFNIPQALSNIHHLLRPGGCIIHASPSNNHVDHGFYQFSPTFFYDYYERNHFEILDCFFIEYQKDHAVVPWRLFNYSPGVLNHISFGGLGSALYATWIIARKSAQSSDGLVPQQGYYRRLKGWQ